MRRMSGKVEYRTGTHNPHTIYVRPAGTEERCRDEIPLGFITDERAAMLAAEMMTAGSCLACPLSCASCTLNQATCECYDHGEWHPTDAERTAASTDSPQEECVSEGETRPFGELRDSGLLWLINRTVFHPRGFALAFAMSDGKPTGWKILGDGSEPWAFNGDEDALFQAAEATLATSRLPASRYEGGTRTVPRLQAEDGRAVDAAVVPSLGWRLIHE